MAYPSYFVRFERAEGDRLTLTVVESLTGSGGGSAGQGGKWLVPSKSLALNILLDLAEAMQTGAPVEDADMVPVAVVPLTAGKAKRLGLSCPLAKAGFLFGATLEDYHVNLAAIRTRAGEFVKSVRVTARRHHGCGPYLDSEPRPQATYTVTVTDPRWLAHVVVGAKMTTLALPLEPEFRSP